MDPAKNLAEKLVVCTESIQGYRIAAPDLMQKLTIESSANAKIILNLISSLLLKKEETPIHKFYALYFVLKVCESQPHHDFIEELRRHDEIINHVFTTAEFDSEEDLPLPERGKTFFKGLSHGEENIGVNYVRLCVETSIYWGKNLGKSDKGDPYYKFWANMEYLSSVVEFPKSYWFVGKTYSGDQELALIDFVNGNSSPQKKNLDVENHEHIPISAERLIKQSQNDKTMTFLNTSTGKSPISGQNSLSNLKGQTGTSPLDKFGNYKKDKSPADLKSKQEVMDQVKSMMKSGEQGADNFERSPGKKPTFASKMEEFGIFNERKSAGLTPNNKSPMSVSNRPTNVSSPKLYESRSGTATAQDIRNFVSEKERSQQQRKLTPAQTLQWGEADLYIATIESPTNNNFSRQQEPKPADEYDFGSHQDRPSEHMAKLQEYRSTQNSHHPWSFEEEGFQSMGLNQEKINNSMRSPKSYKATPVDQNDSRVHKDQYKKMALDHENIQKENAQLREEIEKYKKKFEKVNFPNDKMKRDTESLHAEIERFDIESQHRNDPNESYNENAFLKNKIGEFEKQLKDLNQKINQLLNAGYRFSPTKEEEAKVANDNFGNFSSPTRKDNYLDRDVKGSNEKAKQFGVGGIHITRSGVNMEDQVNNYRNSSSPGNQNNSPSVGKKKIFEKVSYEKPRIILTTKDFS